MKAIVKDTREEVELLPIDEYTTTDGRVFHPEELELKPE